VSLVELDGTGGDPVPLSFTKTISRAVVVHGIVFGERPVLLVFDDQYLAARSPGVHPCWCAVADPTRSPAAPPLLRSGPTQPRIQ
jgi:hypothetical protein